MADRIPEQVAPEVVRALRRRVLRVGQPPEESVYPGDTDPETVHFGVFADDRLAGVASLYRELLPGVDRTDAWRLRGMATSEEDRGTGLGGAVLEACLAHVAGRGGGILWCNARAVAVGFYIRYGLEVVSDEFEVAGLGPHYRMLTAVAPNPKMRKAPTVMSERTLILVKPDGVARGLVGEVISRIERKGLAITRLEMRTIARDIAEQHYGEHVERPFYGDLVDFITSAPLVAMVVEGPDAVASMRNLMGATNPVEATPGSIRGDFATEIGENIVHGSDSPASGEREIKIFFPDA